MRILFCFAQSTLIYIKWSLIDLNHQLSSTSSNFGVSRNDFGDTLSICGE